MAIRKRKYECAVCKRERPRELLMAKKVGFFTLGAGGRTIRSRTVMWVCGECVVKDPDWNVEKYAEAPGTKNFEPVPVVVAEPNG